MSFLTNLKKFSPILVILVLLLGAFNFGSYDPNNEVSVLTPELAEANHDCNSGFSPMPPWCYQEEVSESCEITSSAEIIETGSSVTISWVTTGYSTVTLNGELVGSLSGSKTFTNVQNNTNYTLVARTADGNSSCSTSVYVSCIPPVVIPAPTCTLAPTSKTINSGEAADLSWTTTNAASASLTSFGSVTLSGSKNTGALTTNKAYILTVLGNNGQTINCNSNITVTPPVVIPAPTCTLAPTSKTINSGESADLSWTTTNAASASLTSFGSVPLSGSRNTGALTTGKTYTLTVLGNNGQTVSCNSNITVTPPVVPTPSCDSFGVSPVTITKGNSALLTWATSNANRVVINNGIGEVSVDGSYSVTPLATISYLLTAYGADNSQNTCSVTLTVQEPPVVTVPKCDAFTATPASLPVGGGNVKLAWITSNASVVSISPTIGTVALNSSTTIAITATSTFILTASDAAGKNATCTVVVPVAPPIVHTPISCAANVNLSASPNPITRGGSSALTWVTNGITGVSFDNGISATGLSGSVAVSPTSDTTYTLKATDGIDTISCPVSVNVSTSGGGGGGGGSSSPRCELSASKNKINSGEKVVLTWDSSRATELLLEDDTENITLVTTKGLTSKEKDRLFDGTITVYPKVDTEYLLTVKRGSSNRKCTVEIDVKNNVVVTQVRDQQPLVAGIALSQVPYTGFEAGPILTLLFYILLMAWSLYIAYLLVIRRNIIGRLPLQSAVQSGLLMSQSVNPDLLVVKVQAPEIPASSSLPINLPTGTPVIGYSNVVDSVVIDNVSNNAHHMIDDVEMTRIENHAHAERVLLSSDAIRHFITTTSSMPERMDALDQVIQAAKAQYPAEDGWIVLNENRMQELCVVCMANKVQSSQATYIPTVIPEGAGSLAEAIVTGNIIAAYELIGHRPMFALADAAADLDAVYRIRRGGEAVASELLMKETAALSNEQILKMIEALTGALDGTYTDEADAVKISIMKAMKVVV